MKGIYNTMSLKNISIDFLTFDNAYKPSMLLSLSGSKLQTRVYGGVHTPWYEVSTKEWIHQTRVWGEGGTHPGQQFQTTKLQ